MKRTLAQVNTLREAKNTAYLAKLAEARAIQEDESKGEELSALLDEAEALKGEVDTLDEEAKGALDLDAEERSAQERHTEITRVVNRPQMPTGQTRGSGNPTVVRNQVPAVVARARESDLRSFKRGTLEQRAQQSYDFAQWFLASQFNHEAAVKYCKTNGIEIRAASEGVNSLGGAVVPQQFDMDLIDLREEYGVFRRNAKQSIMTTDTKTVPRRTGGLTAYWGSENAQMSDSDKTWDDVELVAKKLYCLAKYSAEYNEDAMIQVGNDLAEEIAYAFAFSEDDAGFNGDGSSTYGRILGVRPKLRAVDATIGNIKGLKVASGNAYSEITLADFNGVKALLPQYARRGRVKWYCSQAFYSGVMERIALAAGGVTEAGIVAGVDGYRFMGAPVEIVQVMPETEANSQICCLYGDMSLSVLFGDRRSTTIATSEHANFEKDQWTIRGTERLDINVHDVGSTSKAGPLVGLITAAS